ncbi:MAG TPA: response regulator transcription factor [Vicinamibacterales bacterium]|nr:response regulator transcription factor [Vicinamibacterales bacterium]
MTTGRILLVEDDKGLARILIDNLKFEGFDVTWLLDGSSLGEVLRTVTPDLVLLDVMLPGRSGFELLGALRARGRTPVIMLTAKGQRADKLKGLDLGADDYVTKPFDLQELMARIRAVLRRVKPSASGITLGAVTIDFASMVAWRQEHPIHLTHREFALLRYLAERPERVVHRDELLREIWGYPDTPSTRSVDHAIARLRKKIEDDARHPRFIHTVHGDGYCLTPGGRSFLSS